MPYSIAVTIEEWRDRTSRGIVDIGVATVVERDSQKAIVIGRRGQMIKESAFERVKPSSGSLAFRSISSSMSRWKRAGHAQSREGLGTRNDTT